jgi:hypothetical protein
MALCVVFCMICGPGPYFFVQEINEVYFYKMYYKHLSDGGLKGLNHGHIRVVRFSFFFFFFFFFFL